MKFVYILKSLVDNSYYVGVTDDVQKRLGMHNGGHSKYSSTKRPFTLVWYGGFLDKNRAFQFEKYLKAGSGMAFRNKHLI